MSSTTPDMPPPLRLSAVVVARCYSHKGGDLLALRGAEFGKLGDHDADEYGADSGY